MVSLTKPRNQLKIEGLPKSRADLQYTYQVPYPCFNTVRSPWCMLDEGFHVSGRRKEGGDKKLSGLFHEFDGDTLLLRKHERNFDNSCFYSGGELQKICLSRALVLEPDVVILDEPFNNLDFESHKGLLNIIRGNERTSKTTKILILHDIYLALGVCDYIILMSKGRIEFSAPCYKLLNFLRSRDRGTLDYSPTMLRYLGKVSETLNTFRSV